MKSQELFILVQYDNAPSPNLVLRGIRQDKVKTREPFKCTGSDTVLKYNKWSAKYIGVNILQWAGRLVKLKREDKKWHCKTWTSHLKNQDNFKLFYATFFNSFLTIYSQWKQGDGSLFDNSRLPLAKQIFIRMMFMLGKQ